MRAVLTRTNRLKETSTVRVTGSKSESNRLLILKALFPKLEIRNRSESDDTRVLHRALTSTEKIIDIHHAGTAMRFLTAYFAAQPGREVILKGSERMHQRPIGVLVDALRSLGADITYLGTDGCPPLQIIGQSITMDEVVIDAQVSSQYISALMLIAPSLPNGLTIRLQGDLVSQPYLEMTLTLLQNLGIEANFQDQQIAIKPIRELERAIVTVESDWSSASYFYSLAALSSKPVSIGLESYTQSSLQGDSVLPYLFETLGVQTKFDQESQCMNLFNEGDSVEKLQLNLNDSPDLAQTIAVCCLGLGISCELNGLSTLKIKETDRLEALKSEMEKLGATVAITDHSLHMSPPDSLVHDVQIETYHDHRMAMAFAPLALKVPLTILDAGVVSKSYPTFWEDLDNVGVRLSLKE